MWLKKIEKFIESFGMDKIAHFAMSGLLTLIIGHWLYFAIAGGIVIVLGVIKELWDKKTKNLFDKKDLLADIFGVIFGMIFLII